MVRNNLQRNAILVLLLISSALADSSIRYERRSLTKTGSNINETYVNNSEGHTLRTALFGCVAAVGMLAGLLFLVDKEVSSYCVCTDDINTCQCSNVSSHVTNFSYE